MGSQILFIGYDRSLEPELLDYAHDKLSEAHFAHSDEQAINILGRYEINAVIITLRKPGDAAIMNYINKYYKDIRLLVTVSKALSDLIKVFSEGNYSVLTEPFKLKDLNGIL